MANKIILPLKNSPMWIEPRDDHFRFRTPAPSRIGDVSEIYVGRAQFMKPSRVVRVIWLEAENGTRWLVECSTLNK